MKKILPVVLLLFAYAASFAQQQSNHAARRGPWNNFDSLFKSHIGNAYVPFDVTTLDGKRLTNQSCKGKVTVLNFWFEECEGCRGEIKCLNALYDSLKKDPDVVFAAITFDAKETLPQFIKTFKLNYPIATTSDQQESYRLNYHMGFPTTIILDKSGKVAMMKMGIAEKENMIHLSMQQVYDKIAELKLTN